MIKGYKVRPNATPEEIAQMGVLFNNAQGVIDKVATDSSLITRDALPPGYTQFYQGGGETRLYINVNNTITSIKIEDFVQSTTTTKNSIEESSGDLQLVGDLATPSANTFYGTDASGNRTWTSIDCSILVGNLSTTNLNSGTNASATTFWAGSGVWAIPSGILTSVSQGDLNTDTAGVSMSSNNSGNLDLTGGAYGFYPQTWGSNHSTARQARILEHDATPHLTARANIYLLCGNISGARVYASQRYITASSKDHWTFFLVNKITNEIISCSTAPDHPSANSGGTEEDIPHPFGSYDPSLHDIIIIDNDKIDEMKSKVTSKRSLIQIIQEDYEIDFVSKPEYKPREIVKIDEYGDYPGEIVRKIKTPNWAKLMINSPEVFIKRRMVEKLPEYIKFKRMKLKT